MNVQRSPLLTAEKAAELLKRIYESDVDLRYKKLIEANADPETFELYIFENAFAVARELSFVVPCEVIPQVVGEYISYAYLDEIERDNPEAMLDLGSLYYTGRIGEQSYAEAVKFYKMAYEHGNLIACENLGYCYYYGRSVEVDYKKAYHYFIVSALSGRQESMYKIGDMYLKGLYVDKDEAVAFMMYDKAYQAIDEDCDVVGDICLRMGDCFYYGTGCERDIQTALFFFQRSELFYYDQLKNGDLYKRKILDGVIEKIENIRKELKSEIENEGFYSE